MPSIPRVRRIGVVLSVTMNVLVLAAAIWVGTGGYVTLGRTFIVEPLYERWTSQWDELPVHASDTVFLGDSLTEFGNWDELFPDSSVKNRGIAGDDTAGVLARLEQVTAAQPRQVFLMIGTNDLTAGDEVSQIVGNVEEIVNRIHRESPRSELFVQSLLPRGENYREDVEALNDRLEAVAATGGATWVDLYPAFLDEDGSIADQYSNDELHLLGKGYLVWRDAIAAHVNAQSL
jgi:lysophospholipase L1-like esterase